MSGPSTDQQVHRGLTADGLMSPISGGKGGWIEKATVRGAAFLIQLVCLVAKHEIQGLNS